MAWVGNAATIGPSWSCPVGEKAQVLLGSQTPCPLQPEYPRTRSAELFFHLLRPTSAKSRRDQRKPGVRAWCVRGAKMCTWRIFWRLSRHWRILGLGNWEGLSLSIAVADSSRHGQRTRHDLRLSAVQHTTLNLAGAGMWRPWLVMVSSLVCSSIVVVPNLGRRSGPLKSVESGQLVW